MKKIIISLIFVVCAIHNTTAQKVTPSQLKIIEGAWVGSLTYLDYKSGKPFTMPANIAFQQSKDNPNIFLRSIGYSTEPHANKKDSMIISMDGRMIDEFTIISNKILKNGIIQIIKQKKAIDGNDNKPATIRHIYTIGKTKFIDKKEVKFDGKEKWIVRNTYTFTR